MNDRDCENCIHRKPFSPDGINIVYGCEKWDCEYEEKIDED